MLIKGGGVEDWLRGFWRAAVVGRRHIGAGVLKLLDNGCKPSLGVVSSALSYISIYLYIYIYR